MKPVERARVLDQVIRSLVVELQSGAWSERVPGSRSLASTLKVSQPTVAEALKRLAEQGLLTGGGERRAYQVKNSAGSPLSPLRSDPLVERHLILISQQPISSLSHSERECAQALHTELNARGWEIDYLVLDFAHALQPQLSWDRRIQTRPGSLIVALQGRPALAQWALERRIPILFLGGINHGLPIARVGINSTGLIRESVRHLCKLGHSRMVLPLLDRMPAFKQTVIDAFRSEMEAAGKPFVPAYHVPARDYSGADVIVGLMTQLIKTSRPTAWMFLDLNEMISGFSVLAKHRIRVPEDASLILLGDSEMADWFIPRMARFRFPLNAMVRHVVKWLESGGVRVTRAQSHAVLLPGRSTAPPKH
jgi:DNA-binding LacI/PurR family transcriptional regulator